MRAVLAIAVLIGCRADFQLTPGLTRGASPLADAGIGTTVRIGSAITLDGSGSIDPDGTITTYRWRLVSSPPSSAASIIDADTMATMVIPDIVGEFTFELTVVDSDGLQDQSAVTYQVIPLPLTVNAGNDVNVEWRRAVQLGGTVNAEGTETPVLTWSFVSRPARSAAVLQNPSTLTPSFVADAEGTYVLQLMGQTSQHMDTDTITVVAAVQRIAFQGAFIDAVFAGYRDRLVAISDSPPRVRFINPATGTETSIPLPSTPIALSVDQYDNYAAVATNMQVHIFDIYAQTLTGSYNVPFSISSLVFGPYQVVHCFTPQAGPIHTLDLTTGQVGTPSSFSVSGGTVAKLHLNHNVMYGADTTVTPAKLTQYGAGSAPVLSYHDPRYTAGEYAIGGNLWVYYDSIVVRAGNVFIASIYAADDMVYRGRLGGDEPATVESILGYDPKLITLHSLSAMPPPYYQLRLYDHASLALLESAPLPDLIVNGTPQPSTGRLVAYSMSFPNKFVIVASAGSSNAFLVTSP